MSKSLAKLVEAEALDALGPFGFTFADQAISPNCWRYQRESETAKETIVITRTVGRFDAQLSTSYSSGAISPRHWSEGNFFTYSNVAEARSVLRQMLQVIVEAGIPWLEKYCVPPQRLSESDGRRLLQAAPHLADSLTKDLTGSMEPSEVLVEAGHYLVGRRSALGGVGVDAEAVLRVSALYGELLRKRFDGKWIWNDAAGTPEVLLRDSEGLSIPVLGYVLKCWSYEDDPSRIARAFETLVRVYGN